VSDFLGYVDGPDPDNQDLMKRHVPARHPVNQQMWAKRILRRQILGFDGKSLRHPDAFTTGTIAA